MPNYYNSYASNGWMPNGYNTGFNTFAQPVFQQPSMSGYQQSAQYMVQVDGEMAARAWQAPNNLPPRTVIPLWDYDGIHVYFKSIDDYGRMNPMRKARIVFEDEPQMLPQGQSQQASNGVSENEQLSPTPIDTSKFVTKDDFDSLKNELKELIGNSKASQNQNGNSSSSGGNRGGNR